MDITLTFRHMKHSDALKDYVDKKLTAGITRLIREPASCHVVLGAEKIGFSAELILEVPRGKFRAREDGKDLNVAFDAALSTLKAQLRKFTDRKKNP